MTSELSAVKDLCISGYSLSPLWLGSDVVTGIPPRDYFDAYLAVRAQKFVRCPLFLSGFNELEYIDDFATTFQCHISAVLGLLRAGRKTNMGKLVGTIFKLLLTK